MLEAFNTAMARSSQSNSNWPRRGSINVQANSPVRTTSMPAARINSASTGQRDSGQNSG